jgi:hypothetical protein
LSRPVIALLAVSSLTLAGCGSSSTRAQQAVSHLQSALQTYNSAAKTSVVSTSAACREARDELRSDGWPTGLRGSGSARPALVALHRAYVQATRGLSDCALAAPFDYALMARADDEIRLANFWITRTQHLDRGAPAA